MGRKRIEPQLTPEQLELKQVRKRELLDLIFEPEFINLEEKIFKKNWNEKIENYFKIRLPEGLTIPFNKDYKQQFNDLSKIIDKLYNEKERLKEIQIKISDKKKQEKETIMIK